MGLFYSNKQYFNESSLYKRCYLHLPVDSPLPILVLNLEEFAEEFAKKDKMICLALSLVKSY